jgi:hypothetical protein
VPPDTKYHQAIPTHPDRSSAVVPVPDNAPRPVETGEGLSMGLLPEPPKAGQRIPGGHYWVKVTKCHRSFTNKGELRVSFYNEEYKYPVFVGNPASKSYENVFGTFLPPEDYDEYWYWQAPHVMKIMMSDTLFTAAPHNNPVIYMAAFIDKQAWEEGGGADDA